MDCAYDRYFWRQVFILSTGCFTSISAGMLFAHTGVLNKAILTTNSTDISTTSDEASWMAASTGFSGIVGFFLLTPIFQIVGRKPVHICMGIITISGWIILSLAKSVAAIWTGRIIQGISFGGVFILAMTVAEYVHPKRRGYFLTIKKVALAFGSLVCHALSLVCTWRQIAAFAAVVCALNLIALPLWPETPAFLAMKGRFEQCKESYRWLNERSSQNDKELQNLISFQSRRIDCESKAENKPLLKKLSEQLSSKDFIKPCFIVALTSLAIDCSGRFFLLAYITKIIVMVTSDNHLAVYCSIAFDGLVILALSISSILVAYFRRRALLFRLGILSVILMFSVSIIPILQMNHIAQNLTWIVPWIVLLQGFVAYIGLIPVGFALSSEVFPLEVKGLGACGSGVVYTSLYAFTMKMTPMMLDNIGIEGTYSTYGFIVSVCLAILYFILPETKDKTLQEVENEMRGVKRSIDDNKLMAGSSFIGSKVRRTSHVSQVRLHLCP